MGLTGEELEKIRRWQSEWRKALEENWAAGFRENIERAAVDGTIKHFYQLLIIEQKTLPGNFEKRFIGIDEDLTLKQVHLKYCYDDKGVKCEAEVKPVDYKKVGVSPEAVARIVFNIIRG
ncbi:MAG: hypothetical protein QXD73_04395 [Candidatus Bathyarchaeia archaeon]